jgi:hypothetical protein
MSKFKLRSITSTILIAAIFLLAFFSMLQCHNKTDKSFSSNTALINKAVDFVKEYILYPYLSAFVEVKGYVGSIASAAAKGAKTAPVRNNIFKNLYYILGVALAVNRNILLLFFLTLAGALMRLTDRLLIIKCGAIQDEALLGVEIQIFNSFTKTA